ncbi:MAG: class I SAM-dependent methyltransferase [Zoogloea sp.]|nr:class I SAM-dependent methyltransferase [Zoogloea sp.]
MHPAFKALFAQLAGWVLAFVLLIAGILPSGVWPLALAQAVSATLVAVALKSDRWWQPIHLGFTPLVVFMTSFHIAPGWYLAAFMLLAVVYWTSFRTQVPLFLSNPQTTAAVAELLPARPVRLLDLGSGTGSLLRQLAPLRPDCALEGVEAAPGPYWLSRFLARDQHNIRLARGDFWNLSWSHYDVVYAFLSPVPMPQVWAKACAEMRPGSLLVSNSFTVAGIDPDLVVEVDDRRGTRLYCYLPGGELPDGAEKAE